MGPSRLTAGRLGRMSTQYRRRSTRSSTGHWNFGWGANGRRCSGARPPSCHRAASTRSEWKHAGENKECSQAGARFRTVHPLAQRHVQRTRAWRRPRAACAAVPGARHTSVPRVLAAPNALLQAACPSSPRWHVRCACGPQTPRCEAATEQGQPRPAQRRGITHPGVLNPQLRETDRNRRIRPDVAGCAPRSQQELRNQVLVDRDLDDLGVRQRRDTLLTHNGDLGRAKALAREPVGVLA